MSRLWRGGPASLCLAALVVACGSGADVRAQETLALRTQQFEPNADGLGYFTVESARSTELGKLIFSLHANYATGVLATWNGDELQTWAVRRQLGMDLQLGIGFKFFDVVVLAPFAPYQEGSGIPGAEFALHPFGDVAVRPKATILHPDVRRIGLAFAIPFSFPTGKESGFYGETGVTVTPTAIAEMRLGALDVGLNLGVRGRKPQTLRGLEVKTQLIYGLAVRLRPFKGFGLQAELWGAGGSRNPTANPANWLAGLNVSTQKGLVLRAGVGSGIGPGYGSPKFRAVFGIGAGRPAAVDRDRDTRSDSEDLCPGQAEDVDGFEDGDGCPDPDNDGDGILDPEDSCPDEAETINEFDDEDGCPDELVDARAVEPLADKDEDGIADDDDPCPLYAEDPDGFEDEDGCPDDDNDGDGIADVDDTCPDEAEVINGFADADGCPDEVSVTLDSPTVEVNEEEGRLDLSDHVYFDTGTAILRPESFAVLNKVAGLLTIREDLVGVEVQGHTDERGDPEVNRRLSQARADAVCQYLTNLGVASDRLSAIGHGPDRPLVDGHDEQAWSVNRRVEFHIVE